jgi:DNA repair protein RAD5
MSSISCPTDRKSLPSRLEDLYSLLHFIRLEPWGELISHAFTPLDSHLPLAGNWSFFRTFVTEPFAKKDPRAIEIIQVVLEQIRESTHPRERSGQWTDLRYAAVLRREKKMKDKHGQPIISLPQKHIKVDYLTFTDDEQKVYDALYQNAKSKFLGFAAEGTVLKFVPPFHPR